MNESLLTWLLEPKNPSARYFALRDLLDRPATDGDLVTARSAIMRFAPVQAILEAQYPAGYWMKPGRGYSPKYRATIWQLIFLADLGAVGTDGIARACEHVIANALRADYDLFSAHKHSTGILPCLNGDLVRALWHFGFGDHPAVRSVARALARRVSVNGYICVRNGTQIADKTTWHPCLWGCVKVLRGFAAIPSERRSPAIDQAIERGVDLLLSADLTRDQFPALAVTRSHWLRFGYPLGYGSDLLEALLALTELGVTASLKGAGVALSGSLDLHARPAPGDPGRARSDLSRLEDAIQVVLDKRDEMGRWLLEYALRNSWADFGPQGAPNKWVTLRALTVLRGMATRPTA
jgi:hypothetical protein